MPIVALAIGLLTLALAPAACADGELPAGSQVLEFLDASGRPDTRAGSHPDRMLTRLVGEGPVADPPRSLEMAFPVGMGGDPSAIPACKRSEFDAPDDSGCPADTRVGSMRTVAISGNESVSPVFNLEPGPGEVASFGALQGFLRFKFSGRLRTSDLALVTEVSGLPQQKLGEALGEEPNKETIFEFWGVPADHQGVATAPRRAFLTLPTQCDGHPLRVTVGQRTWEHPDEVVSGVAETASPLTRCAALPFSPRVDFQMDNPVADAPTGFSLDMEFPETEDVDAPASSQARGALIEFPEGMAVSAGAANRFTACTDAQLAKGTDTPASCPRSSRVGSVQIGVPQLETPLEGSLFLGTERPGERFRLFAVAKGNGTEAKFVAAMRPNPATGRLGASLDDLPQISLGHMLMRFDGGPGGLFVAPPRCGLATVDATVTPYSGTIPVHASDGVSVGPRPGGNCGEAAPFAPTMEVALGEQHAGRPTSFRTLITRKDGEQSIEKFGLVLPPGLTARLGAAETCSDAAVAANACPAGSKLGSSAVVIGTGSETAELDGDAYLTGPTKGQPFGMAMVLAAKLGPFDLGTLEVRAGMKMDPLTGQVRVQTDSLPQSVEGVPVRIQAIELRIDRPGFMLTPTSCAPQPVTAAIVSTEGAVAHPTGTLAMHYCVGLPFRPSVSLALTDRKEMHRHGHPGLRMTMRARPGEANMEGAALLLPGELHFSPGTLEEICTRRRAMRGECPPGSRVGTSRGHSTLLAKQMHGSVYVVQPQGAGEPDLWASLHGEGIELNLRSTSRVKHGRTESGFTDLPDVPLAQFEVEFADHGVLVLQHGLCGGGGQRRLTAGATLSGHNGAVRALRVPVKTPKVCPAR